MPTSESTCWTMIRAAATGSPAEREELARRHLGIVHSYLAARWRGTTLCAEAEERGPEAVRRVELLRARLAIPAMRNEACVGMMRLSEFQ